MALACSPYGSATTTALLLLFGQFGPATAGPNRQNVTEHERGEQVRVIYRSLAPIQEQEPDNASMVLLNNFDVRLLLECESHSPTEWAANFFDDLAPRYKLRLRKEWSERKYSNFSDPSTYRYSALIQLAYSVLIEEQRLYCRSVANKENMVLVKLEPIVPAHDVRMASPSPSVVRVSSHPSSWPALNSENATQPKVLVQTKGKSPDCALLVTVVQVGDKFYWKCGSPLDSGGFEISTAFYGCSTASYCANSRRVYKDRVFFSQPTCVELLMNQKEGVVSSGRNNWRLTATDGARPGTYACSIQDPATKQIWAGVVEYFFGGMDVHPVSGMPTKLYFAQPAIQMKDLIWMDPAPRKEDYYTADVLTVRCVVPKYGFAFTPLMIVSVTGREVLKADDYIEHTEASQDVWSKLVNINLTQHGPGIYKVQCIAPVWKTSEWADYSKTLTVKSGVAPHFLKDSVDVFLELGELNSHIVCDALGDPAPEHFWEYGKRPGVILEGGTLTIPMVTEVMRDAVITCTARNKVGQRATKTFRIQVRKPIPTMLIVLGILALVLVITLVACGLYNYRMFRQIGGQIETLLTDEEVKEFFKGKARKESIGGTGSDYVPLPSLECMEADIDEQVLAEYLPYNSNFEVAKENFVVEFDKELGSGEYGIVYKGFIKRSSRDTDPIPVAVKMVRLSVHVHYLKALLSELKILAYVGRHENVVNLIGAYTGNIKNRELYVGVELCQGSMLDFLTKHRAQFEATTELGVGCSSESVAETSFINKPARTPGNGDEPTLAPAHLVQWAGEIAAGMEFISQRRVVHGDLAARNVLLSISFTHVPSLHVKIGDFGLARQLMDYTYIKSQQCPLPWKWMAIESLSQMEFSTKSDVWAYGVTLWELFSIGNIPYAGMTWDISFVDKLYYDGLRLGIPKYASASIFNVMEQCWVHDPKERPKFGDLKQFFMSLEREYNGLERGSAS